MEINVFDDKKIVEIWLTKSEKNDCELRAGLKNIYAEWKKGKYTVGVYESGDRNLYCSTRDLLIYNKKRLAELAVKKAKEQSMQKPTAMEKLQSRKSANPSKAVKQAELER